MAQWGDEDDSEYGELPDYGKRATSNFGDSVHCKVCNRNLIVGAQSAETLMFTRSLDTCYATGDIEYSCPSYEEARKGAEQTMAILQAKYLANPGNVLQQRMDRISQLVALFAHKNVGCFELYVNEMHERANPFASADLVDSIRRNLRVQAATREDETRKSRISLRRRCGVLL